MFFVNFGFFFNNAIIRLNTRLMNMTSVPISPSHENIWKWLSYYKDYKTMVLGYYDRNLKKKLSTIFVRIFSKAIRLSILFYKFLLRNSRITSCKASVSWGRGWWAQPNSDRTIWNAVCSTRKSPKQQNPPEICRSMQHGLAHRVSSSHCEPWSLTKHEARAGLHKATRTIRLAGPVHNTQFHYRLHRFRDLSGRVGSMAQFRLLASP